MGAKGRHSRSNQVHLAYLARMDKRKDTLSTVNMASTEILVNTAVKGNMVNMGRHLPRLLV
jgi:hypothetical protein